MFSSLVNADFYGTISVSHDSVKLYQKAFGFSEMANEIPNEVDTRFGTASAGKVFVAVAILQLIEKGQLRFDSKSSDLLPLFIKKSMRNIPGEKFTYNNSGYFELDRLPAKCAQSYVYDTDNKCYYTNIYSIDAKGTGAGGAFLTEEDVEKFWHALVTGRLISLEMLEKMFTRQSGDSHSNYGYGVWLKKTSDEKWVPFIQGSDPGISSLRLFNVMSAHIHND